MGKKLLVRYNKLLTNSGFTLVEMLVVLAIIVLILSLSAVGIGESMEQARDTQRKSDINQYQALLKNYASRNVGFYPKRTTSAYPASDENNESASLCADLGLDDTVAEDTVTDCPADPNDGATAGGITYRYYYKSNGGCTEGNSCATNYALYARLEVSTNYWVLYSNGRTEERSTVPSF